MTWNLPAAVCLALATLAAIPADVRADDTGVAAAIHTLRREGGKLCMDGHFHHGDSAGMASKAAAMREAIASWSGFTAFEYGSDWGSFRKAANKTVRCSSSTAGSWGCEVQARPCK